jgi:hypothetical protein
MRARHAARPSRRPDRHALLLVALMSIESVHDMFLERAKAIQPYDVGPGGRFWEQKLALSIILDHPNGMGPFEFGRVFGHAAARRLHAGLSGVRLARRRAYLTFVAVTLAFGLRAALVPTPWQPYLIAAYAASSVRPSKG